MVIRKGNKHQLGLFFLLEACQRNAAGWSTAVWPANAKLPLPHRRSSITRPCCSIKRSSAKLLVFTCTSKFERSTGSATESESIDALGLRAVAVIICMITRNFSVISMTSQASLSLSLSQKSLTHNIGSAYALPIIVPTRTCRVCSLLRFDGKKWCFSRLSDSSSPLPFPDRSFFQQAQTLCVHNVTGPSHAACNIGRDLHFRLDRYRDAALAVLYHCSEDLPLNCCNCSAAGRAQRLEWVRRQLDPPATLSSILSQNVQLSTNDGAFARRVSSATRTTGERSLQPPNPSSSPAPTSLTFRSKKNRQRQR